MFCNQCGNQLMEGVLFCTQCGAEVQVREVTEEQTLVSNVGNEQKTGCLDVILINVGVNKVNVIKAVQEWTGLSIKETQQLVEQVPVLMKKKVLQEEAELIKWMFLKAGATVSVMDENGNPVDIVIHCRHCGAAVSDGSDSCTVCGYIPDIPVTYKVGESLTGESLPVNDSHNEKEKTKFNEWWSSCSQTKKIFIVLGSIPIGVGVLYALVAFLREFGYLLFGIAVMIGFIITLTTGTEKEKIEARKVIVQMGVGIVVIIIIVCTIVLKPDFVVNIFQPGANVRNAYLSQYNDNVTIEEAFDNFFDDEKWSTYKTEGYSYVVFTGTCDYLGSRADLRVTFKITGENFIVDSLDINGKTQNDLILYALLAKVYEDFE